MLNVNSDARSCHTLSLCQHYKIDRSVTGPVLVGHCRVTVTTPLFTGARPIKMHTAITRGPPPVVTEWVIVPPPHWFCSRGLGVRETAIILHNLSIPMRAGTCDAIVLGPAVPPLSRAAGELTLRRSGRRHTGMMVWVVRGVRLNCNKRTYLSTLSVNA